MKTLYERLKPEFKEKIDVNKIMYPTTYYFATMALNGNGVTDTLTLEQAQQIWIMSDHYSNDFNITEFEKLFEIND